jgi:hypothetical protein
MITIAAPVCLYAAVDFISSEPLSAVAAKISNALFCGLAFIGEDTGIWDGVPALRLAGRPLGLEVVLGGQDGSFTLEIDTFEFPWDLIPEPARASAHADFSGYLAHLLEKIGFKVVPPDTSI